MFLFVSLASVSAQTPDQLKQVAAQRLDALGQCNAEKGQLQLIGAQVEAGVLMARDQWKAAFEAANPGKTLNEKGVVTEKPDQK